MKLEGLDWGYIVGIERYMHSERSQIYRGLFLGRQYV